MHKHLKAAPPVTEVRRGQVVSDAFIKATQLLKLESSEITNIIGVSASTWSRLQNHQRAIPIHSKEAEAMLLFIRIYRSLDALIGGNEAYASNWLRLYNQHLEGIPIELIQKTEGLVKVVMYLDAMRGLA